MYALELEVLTKMQESKLEAIHILRSNLGLTRMENRHVLGGKEELCGKKYNEVCGCQTKKRKSKEDSRVLARKHGGVGSARGRCTGQKKMEREIQKQKEKKTVDTLNILNKYIIILPKKCKMITCMLRLMLSNEQNARVKWPTAENNIHLLLRLQCIIIKKKG